MKLKVSSKNEFEYIPDIEDNLTLKEGEQFIVVFKKLSSLDSKEWARLDDGGGLVVDTREKIKSSIVRLINPPGLLIDGSDVETPLTPDLLMSGKYSQLYELEDLLLIEMHRLGEEADEKGKK